MVLSATWRPIGIDIDRDATGQAGGLVLGGFLDVLLDVRERRFGREVHRDPHFELREDRLVPLLVAGHRLDGERLAFGCWGRTRRRPPAGHRRPLDDRPDLALRRTQRSASRRSEFRLRAGRTRCQRSLFDQFVGQLDVMPHPVAMGLERRDSIGARARSDPTSPRPAGATRCRPDSAEEGASSRPPRSSLEERAGPLRTASPRPRRPARPSRVSLLRHRSRPGSSAVDASGSGPGACRPRRPAPEPWNARTPGTATAQVATRAAAPIFSLVMNMVPITPSIKVIAWAETIPAVESLPGRELDRGQGGRPDQCERDGGRGRLGEGRGDGDGGQGDPPSGQAVAELVAGPGEPSLDRADRPAQAVGGLLVGQAFEVAEDDGHPVVARQAVNLLADQGLQLAKLGVEGRVGVDRGLELGPLAGLAAGRVGSGSEGDLPGHAVEPLGRGGRRRGGRRPS